MARMLKAAWSEASAIALEEKVSLRSPAHMLAVRRVAQANRLRGLYA
jgi:glutamate dehydrogenase/leucine dehydrogenase